MERPNRDQLLGKVCRSCEGGVPPLSPEEVGEFLEILPNWERVEGSKKIQRRWVVRDFAAGIDFFVKVAELAEREGHHPDLHIEGYRDVTIVLWTHAIGGLSENDFILAAKIDEIPIALRQSKK